MNYADCILAGVLLLGGFAGYKSGFIACTAVMLRWCVPLLLSILLYQPLAARLTGWFDIARGQEFTVALVVIFFTAATGMHVLTGVLLKRIPAAAVRSRHNKLAGIASGLLGAVWCGVVLVNMARYSQWTPAKTQAQEGLLSAALLQASEPALDVFRVDIPGPELVEKIAHAAEGAIEPVQDFDVNPQLEVRMLQLVNAERRKYGMKPLVADEPLRRVARAHAADMFVRGYFSHNTPEGKTPFNRMKEAGIIYRAAGENLAISWSLEQAHQGLMRSPGHRANILNGKYGRVGIGIQDAGEKGLMIAQEFCN